MLADACVFQSVGGGVSARRASGCVVWQDELIWYNIDTLLCKAYTIDYIMSLPAPARDNYLHFSYCTGEAKGGRKGDGHGW